MSSKTPLSSTVPTDQLLTWASGLKFADLSEVGVETLRNDVTDALGCGLFGSTLPATLAFRAALLEQSSDRPGPCTLWGTDLTAAALDAVVVNGAGLNGFELDGGCHLSRNCHGQATVYPVIIAVSELTHAVSGEDFMAAAAVGWETSVRMSLAMGPTVMDRGWYGTPMYMTLGSSVAAGRGLHLDAEQMKGAFELALLHARGLTVAAEEGMGKPLSSGEAVRSGLLSALLAAKGCRGPRHSYDHEKGFAKAFSTPSERNDDALIMKPGDPVVCEHLANKMYASCGAGHTVTDIIGDFMKANPAIGPDTVESVKIRASVTTANHIGRPYVPSDTTNAQFNLTYCVAAQLLEGDNSIDQFRIDLLADERILKLAERIEVIPDATIALTPKLRGETFVTMRLTDGSTLEGTSTRSRDGDRDSIRKKFSGLAAHAITTEQAEKVLAAVDNLENLEDAAVIGQLLAVTK